MKKPLKSDICIISTGMITSIGLNAPMTASSVRCGISRFQECYMIDRAGNNMVLSLQITIDESIMGLDRFLALGIPAAKEALSIIEKANIRNLQIPIYIGLPSERPGLDPRIKDEIIPEIEKRIGVSFSRSQRDVLSNGHASGLMALEKATQLIQSRRAEICLVGGIDTYFDPDTLEWMDENKRLHSDVNKDGEIPGEGAGFLLVASTQWAKRYQLRPLAYVLSIASDIEPYPFTSNGICIGQGLTRVLQKVLKVLDSTDLKADWVICDMNGESFRGTEWTYTYLRTGKSHRDPLGIWHPADCYGDVGAASGALLIGVTLDALDRNYGRGQYPLIWTSSDQGELAAIVLGQASSNSSQMVM